MRPGQLFLRLRQNWRGERGGEAQRQRGAAGETCRHLVILPKGFCARSVMDRRIWRNVKSV